MNQPRVVAVAKKATHEFTKPLCDEIRLLKGLGVEGDAHCGVKVKHRSRVAANPDQLNLRQVHLMHSELLDSLAEQGFDVGPGILGENITTRGIDILGLPTGTLLHLGEDAVVELTGLRNPCSQIEAYEKGLLKQVVSKTDTGEIIRMAGVMGIVIEGGIVKPDAPIKVTLPPEPHLKMDRV